jgi:hypothetical protein
VPLPQRLCPLHAGHCRGLPAEDYPPKDYSFVHVQPALLQTTKHTSKKISYFFWSPTALSNACAVPCSQPEDASISTIWGEKMLHVDTFATHQWHCLPG